MTTKGSGRSSQSTKKPATPKPDKALISALAAVEKLAKERILDARDPFAVGIRIADQVRVLADIIEDEVRAETLTQTEAGYAAETVVGVGVGVI
jgi:hypothetical protein